MARKILPQKFNEVSTTAEVRFDDEPLVSSKIFSFDEKPRKRPKPKSRVTFMGKPVKRSR